MFTDTEIRRREAPRISVSVNMTSASRAGRQEYDHQSSYIEFRLRINGVRDVRTLVVEHTRDGFAEASVEYGRAQARVMAAAF